MPQVDVFSWWIERKCVILQAEKKRYNQPEI